MPTDIGPADYVLFVDKNPIGIIETKRGEEGMHLTIHEEQTEGYRSAKLNQQNLSADLLQHIRVRVKKF